MRYSSIYLAFLGTLVVSSAWSPSQLGGRHGASFQTRREFFTESLTVAGSPLIATMGAAVALGYPPSSAEALDMDAFINQELADSSNRQQQLSEDEALCNYGFPSKATGEACVRAGMSTKRSGSLDAFGKVDRGDFIRCKQFYKDTGTAYEKVTVCDQP